MQKLSGFLFIKQFSPDTDAPKYILDKLDRTGYFTGECGLKDILTQQQLNSSEIYIHSSNDFILALSPEFDLKALKFLQQISIIFTFHAEYRTKK